MSQYHEILSDFAHALEDDEHPINCLSNSTQQNFKIYRNNIQQNRVNALQIAFPTINALLGEAFFAAMALVYIAEHPASHANLHAEGATFAAFIAQFPPAAAFPYLSDVARLDWAIHRAHYAVDIDPISAEQIAAHAERLDSLIFEFHPAMQCIASPYPIAKILAMHQGGPAPEDLNEAECVLVWRDQYSKISVPESHFITALQAQQSLADALDIVAEFDPQFDPGNTLNILLQQGLISGLNHT